MRVQRHHHAHHLDRREREAPGYEPFDRITPSTLRGKKTTIGYEPFDLITSTTWRCEKETTGHEPFNLITPTTFRGDFKNGDPESD